MPDGTIRFEDCKAIHATEKALLVEIEGEKVWVPRSVIDDDSEVYDDLENAEGVLVVKEWWAEKNKLV